MRCFVIKKSNANEFVRLLGHRVKYQFCPIPLNPVNNEKDELLINVYKDARDLILRDGTGLKTKHVSTIIDGTSEFNFRIPLNVLFVMFADYTNGILSKQKIKIGRSRNDDNYYIIKEGKKKLAMSLHNATLRSTYYVVWANQQPVAVLPPLLKPISILAIGQREDILDASNIAQDSGD
ncbi:hypothetical protein ABEB36_007472 [Hypothenemus hampei]|uniref:Uncharacterized protein n=1 Tax=Hypothenemus hampei TaxID=57062 RepID=A0ABD1EU72_HYPHA